MAKDNYHVIARTGGRWGVVRRSAARAARTFASKSEAVEHGREAAKRRGSELIIHRRDGHVSGRHSYQDKSAAAPSKK